MRIRSAVVGSPSLRSRYFGSILDRTASKSPRMQIDGCPRIAFHGEKATRAGPSTSRAALRARRSGSGLTGAERAGAGPRQPRVRARGRRRRRRRARRQRSSTTEHRRPRRLHDFDDSDARLRPAPHHVPVHSRATVPARYLQFLPVRLQLDLLLLAAAPPPGHPHHAWAALPFLSAGRGRGVQREAVDPPSSKVQA